MIPAVQVDDLLASGDGEASPNRTEKELRHALRTLEQISAAAQVFALELDLQQLGREIAHHAAEILRADKVIFFSNVDQKLRVEATWPETFDIDSPPANQVLECIRRRVPLVDNTPREAWCRNMLSIPLVASQQRVLGVIQACNKRSGGIFTAANVRAAKCLARVAVSALDRAFLFGRMEQWRRSMETLLSFNATVNQNLEPGHMVQELVANVIGFLDADGGMAGVLDQSGSRDTLVSEFYNAGGELFEYGRRWRPGEGIPGTVFQTEFPLLINDYRCHELADPELASRHQIGCCICVPIKNSREAVLGFFELHRKAGELKFDWQDAAFLESLGNTAAVAIENASLIRSLESKNAQIKKLSQNHVRRLEQERQHIARELHDEAGQVLIGLQLRLQFVSGMLQEDQREVRQELADLRNQLSGAANQLRELAKRLRPPTLDELGFEASLRQLVSECQRRQRGQSVSIVFQTSPRLDQDAETALYRIAQECLTNIAKHARATRVVIRFEIDGGKQVFSICDDGIGFDPASGTSGLGLIGIRERVKMLNGEISIRSRRGDGPGPGGTQIIVAIPENSTS